MEIVNLQKMRGVYPGQYKTPAVVNQPTPLSHPFIIRYFPRGENDNDSNTDT
jgi:hypothetical protein